MIVRERNIRSLFRIFRRKPQT